VLARKTLKAVMGMSVNSSMMKAMSGATVKTVAG